jgi:hypothetical protein
MAAPELQLENSSSKKLFRLPPSEDIPNAQLSTYKFSIVMLVTETVA